MSAGEAAMIRKPTMPAPCGGGAGNSGSTSIHNSSGTYS
jgi:hypothetical protein